MNCPKCQSNEVRKNGRVRGKQRYICKNCKHSFYLPASAQESPRDEVELDKVAELDNRVSSLSNLTLSQSLEDQIISESLATDSQPYNLIQEIGKQIGSELKSELAKLIKLPPPSEAISILLLDAENLLIDAKTEEFIGSICTYPIKIKIAFANWRRLTNWDEEFHKRDYQMIHVPGGKDSADAKMAAVGASIFIQYPNVKEVLVCSSDWGLTHLYNHLQTYGLTAYLVREDKETKQITVLNSKTKESKIYSLVSAQAIPSIEELVSQLQELMKAEQQLTGNQWIKLSKLSMLYQEKYGIIISKIISAHSPGKIAKNIFLETPIFAVHQPADQDELFVALFEVIDSKTYNLAQNSSTKTLALEIIPAAEKTPEPENKPVEQASENPTPFTKINSQSDLEKAIAEIIKALDKGNKEGYVSVSNVGTEFHRRYNKAVAETFKRLGLTGNLTKFLQSRPSAFKVTQVNNQYQVAIA